MKTEDMIERSTLLRAFIKTNGFVEESDDSEVFMDASGHLSCMHTTQYVHDDGRTIKYKITF